MIEVLIAALPLLLLVGSLLLGIYPRWSAARPRPLGPRTAGLTLTNPGAVDL